MATVIESPETAVVPLTIADLVAQLGGIPLERIHVQPAIGTATEADQIAAEARTGKLCELIDGTLVEKPMGAYEGLITAELIFILKMFIESNRIGFVYSESGATRTGLKNVRLPDISFYSRERFPSGKPPRLAVNDIAPDLAIEILSPSNTNQEMTTKLAEYFAAGVKLVWYIDPPTRSAKVFTAVDQVEEITANGYLRGSEVLPGFEIRLGEIFERADA